MRMIVYALSAACGCAPAGMGYYRSYYPVVEPVIEYRSASEWGGETALPIGYSYSSYVSPYYVGSPYPTYGNYQYVLDATRPHRPKAAAKRPPTAAAKVAAKVPLPKPRPKIIAKLPPHTKVVVD